MNKKYLLPYLFDYQPLTEDECNEIGGCSCFIGDEKEDIEETND